MSDLCGTIDFSVIVPTFERPDQLQTCLEALANQDYRPSDYEAVIVDDGSCEAISPALWKRFDNLQVTLLRQKNTGPAAARNHGAQHARGRWLLFTDDDCVPPPGWMKMTARELAANPGCVIGGRTINGLHKNLCAEMSQMITDAAYRYYNKDAENAVFFSSNNLAMSTEVFTSVGGFDPAFRCAEDRDFCDRARASGCRLVYVRDSVLEHRHNLSWGSFCRQHFNYGQGALHFFLAQRRRKTPCQVTSPGFHLAVGNWFFHPFTQVPKTAWPKLTVLLIAWQILNATGFAYAAVANVLGKFHLPE